MRPNEGRGMGTNAISRAFSDAPTHLLLQPTLAPDSEAPPSGTKRTTHDLQSGAVVSPLTPATNGVVESPKPVSALRLTEFGLGILAAKKRELEREAQARSDALERQRLEIERARFELERAKLEAARQQERELPTDRLWTEAEAARFLGMSARWLRDSTVPKATLPGKGKRPTIRYEPEEVRAWAKCQRTHSVIDIPNDPHSPKRRRTTK
jgi:hypothetical protein